VEPGPGARRQKISQTKNKQKRGSRRARLLSGGDPQTYALLHCSVFKEQTPEPGPCRAGLLTAPNRRGARVTANIIAPGQTPVKESSERAFRKRSSSTGREQPPRSPRQAALATSETLAAKDVADPSAASGILERSRRSREPKTLPPNQGDDCAQEGPEAQDETHFDG